MTTLNRNHRKALRGWAPPAVPGWLLRFRGAIIWLFHIGLAAGSNYIAFWIHFEGRIPPRSATLMGDTLATLLAIRGSMFVAFRLYEGLWRYTSFRDIRNILLAVASSSLVFLAVVEEGFGASTYPRSVLLIDALLLTGFVGGVRFLSLVHRDLGAGTGGRRVLIYGAGAAGEAVVRELSLDLAREYEPVGFVDDDRNKAGQRIYGVPVLGTREDLPEIMRRHRPDEVLVTIPRGEPSMYRAVVRALEPFEVPIKTLPHLREILGGRVSTSLLRDLSLEDLLRRSPVGLSREPLLGLIRGRKILVTGAGGSIGAELCRQIAALDPAAVILYERHENSLYRVLNDLAARGTPGFTMHAVVGDVTDRSRLRAALRRYRPHIVFHAAAHKHVPLMEQNVCEAVKNNVLGTRVALEIAEECGVERFILVSSDKAVNPVSVMGATKRVAELMLQCRASGARTTLVTVRFGNVLGSNGSIVPLFMEQLKHGGPLTVTHPDVRRYFMLIPEAVQLVLHAAAAGESNSIYVLDMGEPVRLLDVARDLIRLSGFRPDDVPITFIGLRPGEKLDEDLVGNDEVVRPSPVQSVMRVQPRRIPKATWLWGQIRVLESAADLGDVVAVMARLRAIVPEFEPSRKRPGLPAIPPVAAETIEPGDPAVVEEAPSSTAYGLTCDSCGSDAVHRSRISGSLEEIRRQLTYKRPYRCQVCGWRGWMHVVDVPPPAPAVAPADLRSMDVAFYAPPMPGSSFDGFPSTWPEEPVAEDRAG